MPSRKQRRRRAKERRHEWEYVYVDEEGREVEVDPAELKPPREKRSDGRGRAQTARPRRRIEPPSWRRVLKRGLLFAPLMFLLLTFLYKDMSTAGHVLMTVQLLVLFIPFSYLMDRIVYRRYVRQTGGSDAAQTSRKG